MAEITVGGKHARDENVKKTGEVLEMNNPSADRNERKRPPRVSLSTVRQRLQVPDIPGYRLYWFKDENIPAAVDAYYEPVKRSEIATNPVGIGSNYSESGNTDLGSNVSIVAGQNSAGQPVRLNLMKLLLEYYEEDQKMIEQKNMSIMTSIFGDEAKTFDRNGNLRDIDPLTYRKTALLNRGVKKRNPQKESSTLRERLRKLEEKLGIDL